MRGHKNLKQGLRQLLGEYVTVARVKRIKFNLISAGSRTEAMKDFLRYCRTNPSDLNVLLIDSEGPVNSTAGAIRSLRSMDLWKSGIACDDNQVHLMVQAMEAWFIADPGALASHFGNAFNTNVLPSPQNAESVAPSELLTLIKRGLSQGRRRRTYDKVSDGMKLLQLVDENTVRANCPHFRRLTDFLSSNI